PNIFTQILPLTAIYLKLPLATVAKAYSLNMVLYHLAFFGLTYGVLKREREALAIVLSAVLMVNDQFYWMQTELPLGLAFLFFTWGLYGYLKEHNFYGNYGWSIWVLGAFTLVSFHTLLVLPMLFFMVWEVMTSWLMKDRQQLKTAILWGVIYAVAFVGYRIFFTDSYEQGVLSQVKNIPDTLPRFFDLKLTQQFWGWLSTKYIMLSLFLLVNTFLLLRARKYLHLVLTWGFPVAFLLLSHGTFPFDTRQFFLDNIYSVMGTVMVFVFIQQADDFWKYTRWIGIFLSLCVAFSLGRIYYQGEYYTERLDLNRKLMAYAEENNIDKVIIPHNLDLEFTFELSWGIPYEVWGLSTIEEGKARSFLVATNPSEFEWIQNEKMRFVQLWSSQEYKALDPLYFPFENDSVGYQFVDWKEFEIPRTTRYR
ncbi:MAG: hypothetical protein AAFR59_05520, partial [Bacteroidota bacterium]